MQMGRRFLFVVIMLLGIVTMGTAAQATVTKTYQIGTVKSTVYVYSKASTKATKKQAGTLSKKSYTITQMDGNFYRLSRGSTVYGWVKKSDASVYTRNVVSKKSQKLYIIGTGAAYRMPKAIAAEKRYNLTSDVAKSFTATVEEKIGKTTWYKGTYKKQLIWVKASDVTLNAYAALDLRKSSSISAKEMQAFLLSKGKLPDNVLYKLAPSFVSVQKSTGINAQFMMAHAILETGWGSSTIAQYKNNFFGYQAYDSCPITCAKYFPTGAKGLTYYAYKINTNYLTTGGAYANGPSALGMNVRYASDRAWSTKIANLMAQMKPYKASDYSGQKAVTKKLAQPTEYEHIIPNTAATPDQFKTIPTNVVASFKKVTKVYKLPYATSPVLGTYTTDKTVKLVAYHSDVKDTTVGKTTARWYRIAYNGGQGWVRSDTLDTPTLGFIKTQTTAHKGAGTNYTKVSDASANTPLKFALSKNKKVTKVVDKEKWYKVYLPAAPNTAVWVASSDIVTY